MVPRTGRVDRLTEARSTKQEAGVKSTSAPAQEKVMTQPKFPDGWDAERVQRVLEHYEAQSDEEAVAEDEAAYEATTHTAMEVPVELVPMVRELIAKRRAG